MPVRRFFVEIAGIVLIAIICAAAANAFAERTRKLAWKADYPNAMTVTQRVPEPITNVPPVADPAAIIPLPEITTSTAVTAPTPTPSAVSPSSALPTPTPAAGSSPQPTPTPAATPRPQKVFAPHPDRPYIEIASEDAVELYQRTALFIDARRTSDYEEAHIAGARSMPVWESDVDQRLAALYEEGRNQQDPIVVYCSGGNCEDSHMLSQKLWGLGFDNVLVYKDGFPDWVKRGGAVTRGANP